MTVACLPARIRYSGLIKGELTCPQHKGEPQHERCKFSLSENAQQSYCSGKLERKDYSYILTFHFFFFFFLCPQLFLKLFTSHLRHDLSILQFHPHFTRASIHNPNTIHPFKDLGCYDGPGLPVQSYLNKNTLHKIFPSAFEVHRKCVQN